MFVNPSELNDEVQSYNYKTVSLLRLGEVLFIFICVSTFSFLYLHSS